MPEELVAIDRRLAEAEVRLDAVAGAGPRIAVVLDQVVLHQRRSRGAVRVQLDPGDVVLDDVVEDLEAAVRSRKARVGPDSGQEAGVGQNRALNGEAVQLQVVGLELHRPAWVIDD